MPKMALSRMEEPREIDDWTRISVLGSGGFGTVLLWRCNSTDDYIAVKKCRIQCPSTLSSKQKSRWRNEVQIMKELNHPNIVKYKLLPAILEEQLNKYNPTKLPLLSMEYCDKGNLRHILILPANLRGLKEESVRDVLLDISSAVSYLHQLKITHRDIKPENIVLHKCPEREEGVIYKLIDLGYAKELGDATVSFVGTLFYLAPEIFSNRNYDCSVDYWSLGVLAFEVICGVLPFSTLLGTADRFLMIKNKGPDDICISKTTLGNFQYSSELFREIRISSCLKGHLEMWLRKALQFDPKLRSIPFPNSLNIFSQLNVILKKKILKVFSVYKYEFYSYEFDECTRLSTVQQWIARDTKIAEKDQLLLGNVQFNRCDCQTLLVDCLAEEKNEVFVFKRNALFNKDRYHLPRRVKLMFEKATELFCWRDIKAMYADAIFYIAQDIDHAAAFSQSMDQFLKYLRTLVVTTQKNGAATRQLMEKLLQNVKSTNEVLKKQPVSVKNAEIFERVMQLFASLERCARDEYHLAVAITKWDYKLGVIRVMYAKLDVIKLPKIIESLALAVRLLHTTEADSNNNLSVVDMSKIVSNVMKLKDKLLSDRNLHEFVTYLGKATDHLESLTSWMAVFHSHIEDLFRSFDIVMADLVPALQASSEDSALRFNPYAILVDTDVEHAITKSEILNLRIEKNLRDGLKDFKKFCDDIISSL